MTKNVSVKQIQNTNELKDEIDNHSKYILFIYADWCGHCKDMKPDMEKFKEQSRKKIGNVFIGFIEDNIIKKYPKISDIISEKLKKNVEGYPTIIYGKQGDKPKELSGERNLKNFNNILSKLCKQSGGKKSLLSLFRKKRTKKRKKRKTRKKRKKRKTRKKRKN
jgi:thiol-disulfide isomerase/thioredoxin